ncbi:hypothetical protein [Metabacillus fastidiosus]|uniref:hypothetical protein n=1 Tax=Metabacillus fastidiosus TaxID=1458 RepID=UPI002DBAD2FC|nr:hypothetical protein [Metabacillus fastidiosus]MEC2078253.1 hypothetical protein [Metabacillus fastidiosus]
MKDLVHIYKKSYDVNTRTFTINKELIKVDEDIHQLIMEHKVLSDKKLMVGAFDYRITEIKKWSGRSDFLYKDIYPSLNGQ